MPKVYRVEIVGRTGKGDYRHGLDVAWLDEPQTKTVTDEYKIGLEMILAVFESRR